MVNFDARAKNYYRIIAKELWKSNKKGDPEAGSPFLSVIRNSCLECVAKLYVSHVRIVGVSAAKSTNFLASFIIHAITKE